MRARIEAYDWATTPLGDRAGWPAALRAYVELILASPVSMEIMWGPDLIQIYNDACSDIMGAKKQVTALGRPTRESWPELWEFTGPIFEAVRRGEARSFNSENILLERDGDAEEAWFDLAYSPLRDDDGNVAGVLLTSVETTDRVLSEQARTATKAALREREGQLALFIAHAPAAISMFDRDMRYLAASRRYLTDYGFPPDTDIIGLSHYELFPEIPQYWRDIHARVMAGETLSEDEEAFIRADGRTDWVRWTMTPWRTGDGAVGGALLLSELVTAAVSSRHALVETAEALRDREARLNAVLSTSPDGIVTIDETGVITSFSEGAERLFGYAAAEVIGRNVSVLMPPPYREAHGGYLERYLTTGEKRIIGSAGLGREVHALRKDGRVFPIELAVDELLLADGRHFVGLIRDITATRQAQEQLAQSEEALVLAIDGIPASIARLDQDGVILSVNSKWREFGDANGASDSTYGVGQNYLAICQAATGGDASMAADMARGLAAVLAGRAEEFHLEYPCHSEKKKRWFHAFVAPLAQYGARGAMITHVDVTEQKRSEEQLHHALKMDSIGRLTGGMAHDFNNLLTVIQGNIELLEARIEEPKHRLMLREAQEATEMGSQLTGQLLAFARRQSLETRVVDPNALLLDLSGLLRRTLGESIGVTTSLAEGVWPIVVDVAQMQNAILNLALNARDAMPEGGALMIETANAELDELSRALQAEIKPGAYVRVSVADTGHGMSEEVRQQIFEPFFTTKAPGKGSGLGLSMVYGFVRQCGGHIVAYSEPGKGTTFNLYFPRASAPAEDAPSKAAVAPAGGSGTVLVVEDNPRVLDVTCARLHDLGYTVKCAANGADALKLMEDGAAFDLLLTDVVMPGMNGHELAVRMRAARPDLRVLYSSGYADPELIEKGIFAEGDQFLRKPYSRAELAGKVAAAMKR